MASLPPEEDLLLNLVGTEIPSSLTEGVVYHLGRRIGEGGMSLAYVALRVAPEGNCPVVLKILRPWFVRRFGDTAALIVRKEAVALGRLNERIPATPFVVRFIDVGELEAGKGDRQVVLPWIALEYVHGGAEGTTLADRVTRSIVQTGSAFDPARAAHAVECLAKGVSAVHEVGVIHRDIKPENVLCCGFGEDEIFKIADFGVARPLGVAATFGGAAVGTPGYAAPELIINDQRAIGPWSDVFSLAAVYYFILTGEPLFPVSTISDAILCLQSAARRSILAAGALHPELREREGACRAIDQALSRATAGSHIERPHDVETLAATLLPWLRPDSRRLRTTRRKREEIPASVSPQTIPGWSWMVRHQPGSDHVIRSVGWDGDGRCLAATNRGLLFWDGTSWETAPSDNLSDPTGIRVVHRIAAGRWLVGCDDGTFAIYTHEGTREVVRLADPSMRVQLFSGDLEDIGIMVSMRDDGVTVLHALIGRRWLKPLPLEDVATITSASRVGDDLWLIAGRSHRGNGLAALYAPLDWEVRPLPTPQVRAFLTCASQPSIGVGLIGGAGGLIVCHDRNNTWFESIEGAPDVSAAVVDGSAACWAGCGGRIWYREPIRDGASGSWECLWEERGWNTPIVSMFADVGLVIAMTADGAMIEGRSTDLEMSAITRRYFEPTDNRTSE